LFGPKSALDALQGKDVRVEVMSELSNETDSAEPKVVLPVNGDNRIEVRNIIPNEVKFKK
jgi:hypothetical protein